MRTGEPVELADNVEIDEIDEDDEPLDNEDLDELGKDELDENAKLDEVNEQLEAESDDAKLDDRIELLLGM